MKIRKELTDALGSFIDTLNGEETKKAYGTDVRDFFSFLEDLSDDVEKETVIHAYFGSVDRRELAPTTLNRRLSSLRKFLGFVVKNRGDVPGFGQNIIDDLLDIKREIIESVQHLECTPLGSQ